MHNSTLLQNQFLKVAESLLNAAKRLLQKISKYCKKTRILKICTGHKHKWLTQGWAGYELINSDTMLNTMLNTHMVYEKDKHTHNKKLNTIKDKRVAHLFFPLYMMYIYNTMVWLLVSHSKVTWTPLWLFTFHTYP